MDEAKLVRSFLKHGQTCECTDIPGIVKVTGKCLVTDKEYSVNANAKAIYEWYAGAHIQNAMPEMDVADREFLISGTSPEGWKELFGDEIEHEIP